MRVYQRTLKRFVYKHTDYSVDSIGNIPALDAISALDCLAQEIAAIEFALTEACCNRGDNKD
jgi:hypothetical protein